MIAYFIRCLLSLVLLLALPPLHAATYAYRSDTFAYDTPSSSATSVTWHSSGTSPACTSYPQGDDDWADIAFPSGFTFTFGGTAYSSVRVYSNGIVAFPPDNSGFHRDYTSQALPITAAGTPGPPTGCTLSAVPVNLMLVYWLDIVAGTANSTTGASVQYELLGTAPNRRFVISWVNVKLYNQTARYNFQLVLYESSAGVNGNFKYQYTTGSSTGSGAAVGVQLSTSDYTQFSYNQNFIDTTLGTAILWYPANQLAAKTAEYRFDEGAWVGTPGEVKDTSGNLQNASRVGAAANVAAGKLCRGGSFTNNTSNTVIDAVATPVIPASRGSVDFWYKSTAAWGSASSDAMLLDATAVAARPFFLLRRANGALRFVVTDSAGTVLTADTSSTYSFAANTWHHIAVSWSLAAGTNQTVLQIILDGALVATSGSTPYRATSSGATAAFSTLYIGDNRTSGVTPSGGSPNGANGTIDEVNIYSIDINATQAAADMALTRPTCTTLDHFHIIHSGEIVNCGGALASVTVEAHDLNHALISLAGTTMAMSTSTNHGTWSSISTINPVSSGPGDGTGSYIFSNESSVTFGLSNSYTESLNINLLSGAITEKSGVASVCVANDYTYGSTCDANLNFAEAGFLFDVLNHVSEVSQSVTLKAVKKSDSSTACVPLFANSSRSLTFTCSYSNPATGTLPVRVGGKALNASNSTGSACDATGQAVSLTFDAAGVAPVSVQYADVGRMTLSASNTASGVTMTGADAFIAAPANFTFSAITAGPIKAGRNFSATVTANNNAGVATPNFGKEASPEGVALTHIRIQPTGTGAVDGSLTGNAGSFANGSATASNLVWTEVGQLQLKATLGSGSYLGSGLTATGTSGNVGVFIPDHFNTVVTQGCSAGAFTYSRQPFTVKVTAMNGLAAPTTTRNYDGSANTSPNFAKGVTLSDANAVAGGALLPNSVAANAFVAGDATATPAFTFTAAQTAPATIKVRSVDTDGVTSAGGTEGVTQILSGRVRLANAYGSELLDLPMTLRAEFWDGLGWARNVADTCTGNTALGAANAVSIVFNNPTPAGLATCVLDSGNPGLSGAGCVAAGAAARRFRSGVTLQQGDFNLWLNRTGVSGFVTVTANVPTWLEFNWTGVAADPQARATFGAYRSPLIYRRENY